MKMYYRGEPLKIGHHLRDLGESSEEQCVIVVDLSSERQNDDQITQYHPQTHGQRHEQIRSVEDCKESNEECIFMKEVDAKK